MSLRYSNRRRGFSLPSPEYANQLYLQKEYRTMLARERLKAGARIVERVSNQIHWAIEENRTDRIDWVY